MNEERIWAPWRIGYVSGGLEQEPQPEPERWQDGAEESCFLCRAAAGYADQPAADRRNMVVARDEYSVTLLNRFPYSNGHLLVAPVRHVAEVHELTDAEHLAIQRSIAAFTQKLATRLKATGFNVGLNLGTIGGAGVPGHLHWHVVPRWPGDHNFMPVTAGIRVIPQSLEAVWEALSEEGPQP